ncbi:hypothetical protein AGR1A_Cc20100 [Agrobacterium fabacearum CFBP 5771]|nr:hypothetical protein AGR1A_Cc20100 [Agrobacterium fabacearum CFBP 5771]
MIVVPYYPRMHALSLPEKLKGTKVSMSNHL